MDALKFSWFFLHSTVVPSSDQHQKQTPAFLPRQTNIMAEHHSSQPSLNSKVAAQQVPPPPGAAFGSSMHDQSRPAFLSPPASYLAPQDASQDSRDEIGSHQPKHPFYSPPSSYRVTSSSIAAEFSPPRSAALRTAPSHDSTDSSSDDDINKQPMPDLPSVPPSSSIRRVNNDQHSKDSPPQQVTFAPPASYHTYEYDPRVGYHYESFVHRPEGTAYASYPQQSEVKNEKVNSRDTYSNDQSNYPNPDDAVTSNDVKFGRGGGTNRHPGNLVYRKLVEDAKPAYLIATKSQKGDISRAIVSAIRSRGGRWLKLDNRSGLWEDVGDEDAAKKVSQALREGLALKRREALIASVSKSGSRSKKTIAYPAHLPISKAKCTANRKKKRVKE